MKKKARVPRKAGFTLLEILIAIIWFSLLMIIVFSMFTKFIHLKYNAQARGALIEKSYFAFEKINLLLKDYTIDYEEYYNRQNVGCSGYLANFSRNVGTGGYCPTFTAYGNRNNIDTNTGNFVIYYCSSGVSENGPKYVRAGGNDLYNGSWCTKTWFQSFGQYQKQFRDVKDDVDFVTWSVGDDDDLNIGKWPEAILAATGVQELYLISQDGTRRIFLRRALIESGDANGDGVISGDTEKFYTIQMLKLRWFDAGHKHNFDPVTSSGVYDGVIDTWACDYAQWFTCSGASISGAYANFKLPADANNGWVNIFERNLTVADWNLRVFPTKNPDYAWKENAFQINPYFTISMTAKLYGGVWFSKLGMPSIESYQLSLQTTFNTKNFYTK